MKHILAHEAGHVVAAIAQGLRVVYVEPGMASLEVGHTPAQEYRVCVGGPIAERLATRRGWSQNLLIHADTDFRMARAQGLDADDARDACVVTARTLRENWPAVEALAEQLAVRGRLDARDVADIVKSVPLRRLDAEDHRRLGTMDWSPVIRATAITEVRVDRTEIVDVRMDVREKS